MDEVTVEVCYATPDKVFLKSLRVAKGTDVRVAIEKSGVLDAAPEIDLQHCRVGIFGKLKTLDTELREHDRIEIYRPLMADPMEARRRRAAHRDKRS